MNVHWYKLYFDIENGKTPLYAFLFPFIERIIERSISIVQPIKLLNTSYFVPIRGEMGENNCILMYVDMGGNGYFLPILGENVEWLFIY